MMTFEEWIKMGYPFLNKDSKQGLDRYAKGEISISAALGIIAEELMKKSNTPNVDPSNPCYGCANYACLYSMFYDDTKSEEENDKELCGNCACNNCGECARDTESPCDNYDLCFVLKF
jgi:hypothetical protein